VVTKKRKLRAGLTVWQGNTPTMFRASAGPLKPFYDVVVIGAGISGALAAEEISRLGLSLLVLDRRGPAAGSTSASTALVQWEIDQPLSRLIEKAGRERATESYLASFNGVRSLVGKIGKYSLTADLVPRRTLLIAGTEMNGKELQREARLRRKLGLPSSFIPPEALARRFKFERDGAIRSGGNCEIDPRKLTKSLLQAAMKRGAHCVFPADVVAMDAGPRGVFLELGDGRIIAARKAIAATGYETLPEIAKRKYDLISTWALATKPVPAAALWRDRMLVWEASDPYLYFRTTPGNRIIVGGEDEAFFDPARRDAKTVKKVARIVAKLHKLLPEAPLVPDYTWAGTFAESPTGLPVIGELDGLPNIFAILGSGGNGITFSAIASEIAAAWVRGKPHRNARLFAAGA
jgi:glycine/D-amino acid oxidase-like deaminating enzyme